MSEEVMPQYSRLMEDKANFDKFKDITEAIKEKNRLYLAYDYSQLKAQVEDQGGTRQAKERKIEQYTLRIDDLSQQLQTVAAEHTEKLQENEKS